MVKRAGNATAAWSEGIRLDWSRCSTAATFAAVADLGPKSVLGVSATAGAAVAVEPKAKNGRAEVATADL
ncbi:hypothetical protein GCM10023190_01900 [Enteractinococcus fodinae]